MTGTVESNTNQTPVVVITGGSMGLGFALSKALLKRGFRVSMCARGKTTLHDAVHQLQPFGEVRGFVGNIADEAFQSLFINETIEAFGRLDAVVNNASTLGDVPLPSVLQSTPSNFIRLFEVNTLAPMLLLQKAIPHLRKQPVTLAIGISSDAAIGGYPNWGGYGASKAALDVLHKTLASEEPAQSLVVYTIDPSDMATAMHEAAIPGDTGLAEPNEVAQAILPLFDFLKGDAAMSFPSGTRLQVRDGHLVAKEVE